LYRLALFNNNMDVRFYFRVKTVAKYKTLENVLKFDLIEDDF